MATETQSPQMKKTLSLTGLTVNAMALIAPGAFLWTTFQMQASQTSGGVTTAGEMWTGLLAALVLAFLTAISYAELAKIYPRAGAGSTYYFAEAAFLDQKKGEHRQWARIAKFVFGWISHLYYWIYPGIMVAFSATLIVYIFGLFGISLNVPEQIAVAVAFAAINGYIAYRGINGSTMTALAINAIQLVALVGFAVLAIAYRQTHPEVQFAQSAGHILLPHNLTNMLFQSTIAILLLVGFESVTALGAEAVNPRRDIKRAILLSLLIQGVFAYLFEYFAANFMIGSSLTGVDASGAAVSGYAAAAGSGAPLGDMMRIIGDTMFHGSGMVMTLVLAITVVIALVGTTLACMNTGVRVTYAMSKDKEMPSVFGFLHGKFATPHLGIWILVGASALIGAYGVLSVDNLTQITLASNTGTFLVYGITNLVAFIAFFRRSGARFLQHKLVPVLGVAANLVMLAAIAILSFKAGGSTSKDAFIALGMVGVWLVAGVAWFIYNTRKHSHPIKVTAPPYSVEVAQEHVVARVVRLSPGED